MEKMEKKQDLREGHGEEEKKKEEVQSSSDIVKNSLSLESTQASHPPSPKKPILPAWLLSSPTNSVSSASRRLCRICQMESGVMVRPCDCAGTMGDVHEECLTKWVNMSKKKTCEICKSEYAKSGAVFKPIRAWERPKPGIDTFFGLGLIACFIGLLVYICSLMEERKFFERVFKNKMSMRPDDTGRAFIFSIICLALIHNAILLASNTLAYFRKQRYIRFIDKHV